MGCDIHCYIEFRRRGDRDNWGGWPRINPGRNYGAFGRLAGVRGQVGPIVPPRGLPSDLSFHARHDNELYICNEPTEGCVTAETAKHYFEKCGSKYIMRDGKPIWVTHPDWHTHSWLTADEWEAAITFKSHFVQSAGDEYEAILAVMRFFESRGYDTRVVFWFDN